MKDLLSSFKFAFRGIFYCIKNERNFRIHIVAALLILSLGLVGGFDGVRMATLCATISLVLFAEMANTAIEKTVDLREPRYNEIAKHAKDLAAGAVLITALLAIGTAAALFFENGTFVLILTKVLTNPALLSTYVVLAVLSVLFIFFGGKKK